MLSLFNMLLDCYWVYAETEHLTMGHQETMWFRLLIMNWVLSDLLKQNCMHSSIPL